MIQALKAPLPQAFRQNCSAPFSSAFISQIFAINVEDEVKPLVWYPKRPGLSAYTFANIDRSSMKRSEHMKEIKRGVVDASDWGAITRQEFVSMIPPLLLKLEPHHRVLDMCASPGSKTNEIMDLMSSGLVHER